MSSHVISAAHLRTIPLAAALLVALALALISGTPAQLEMGDRVSLEASIAKAPLAFEPNAERLDDQVDFLARSVAGGNLFLTGRGAVLALPRRSGGLETLRLDFKGANPGAEAVGLGELAAKANSFLGEDPRRWRSGIRTYGRVRYEAIYPGIDVDFYGNQQNLEYDFRLGAGADPSRIGIELRGADSVRLTGSGDLLNETGESVVRQRAPLAYQEIDGARQTVSSAYELSGSTLEFRLGEYDRSLPLVIDPVVLGYSTYLGGGGGDTGNGIAVDAAGAAYVTSSTNSTDFPTQDGFQAFGGGNDAVVTKFAPDTGGTMALAYSTYLGGTGADSGFDVAVDSAGAAYVTGRTDSTDFPLQDPFQGDQAGTDAFAVKLNPDTGGAVTLAYSTYLGGGGTDQGFGVATDSAGGAYVAGKTASTNFPTNNGLQGDQVGDDGFVTKLNPDGGGAATLAYSTYLGGGALDEAREIAIDSAGAAYVVGLTDSTNFPTQDPYQTNQGERDAFLVKLNPHPGGATPVSFAYSTYLGGAEGDQGYAVDVDSAGAAYVTGDTGSADFPTQDPFQTDQGGPDLFVTKLNPDGGGAATLAYSTYLGGSGFEQAFGLAVDPAGAAYLTGLTSSSNFPVKEEFQADQPSQDAFVAQLEPDGGGTTPVGLGYSTYLGGAAVDQSLAIAVDPAGAAYVTGDTGSTNFPLQDALQSDQVGQDGFVARLLFTASPGPETEGPGDPSPGPATGGDTGGGSTTAVAPVVPAKPDKKCTQVTQKLKAATKKLQRLKRNGASDRSVAKAKKKATELKQAKKKACA